MTRLVNFTPHTELVFRPVGGEPVVLPQQGNARCAEEFLPDGTFEGTDLPRTLMRYGQVTGLPEQTAGVVVVVSQLVVSACPERDDLAFPAGLVRDEAGTIVGFRYLARLAPSESAER